MSAAKTITPMDLGEEIASFQVEDHPYCHKTQMRLVTGQAVTMATTTTTQSYNKLSPQSDQDSDSDN